MTYLGAKAIPRSHDAARVLPQDDRVAHSARMLVSGSSDGWTIPRPRRIVHRTFSERNVPRDLQVLVFAGIKKNVVALDADSGVEVWRTDLRSADFVSVLWDGKALFATNAGEIWRLDPTNGEVLWHNEMSGLGRGLISLASSRHPNASDERLAAEKMRRDAAQAAASAAVVSG